jgi:hypothetical protein
VFHLPPNVFHLQEPQSLVSPVVVDEVSVPLIAAAYAAGPA